MELDTVTIYWDVHRVFWQKHTFLGSYVAIDDDTNTVVEFGTTTIGNKQKSHYQTCIREALDQFFDSHSVNHLRISSVDYADIKPELEIGRLKHGNRFQAQSTPISVSDKHNRSFLLGVLGSYSENSELNGFAESVPSNSTLKVYVDGSYLDDGRASIGICAMKSYTDEIAYVQGTEISAESSVHAEVLAAVEALSRLEKFGVPIRLHSDCESLQHGIDEVMDAGSGQINTDIGRLRSMVDRLVSGKITMIPREENHIADHISTQGYKKNTVFSCRSRQDGSVCNFKHSPKIQRSTSKNLATNDSKHKYKL